tara:strand:+ start:1422 stop:1661 length:240 start_codon:yes stop_codon:yes gene_type:complete
MMQIEKTVPMPEVPQRRRYSRYPWEDMEVGDSFHVPTTSKQTAQSSLIGAANSWAGRHAPDRKFITRRDPDGVRIWRVA